MTCEASCYSSHFLQLQLPAYKMLSWCCRYCSSHDSLTVKKIYHLDLAWVITLLQQQSTFISYFEIAVPLST